MSLFSIILVLFLILCSLSVCFTKNLLISIIIYMAYSVVVSIIWVLLESPDLAITEAAVGTGITSVLFFITLKRLNNLKEGKNEQKSKSLE